MRTIIINLSYPKLLVDMRKSEKPSPHVEKMISVFMRHTSDFKKKLRIMFMTSVVPRDLQKQRFSSPI
jgi:hypothetical protein